MEKITFGFATLGRAHAVQDAIRKAGFKTINTSDAHGHYVSVMTSEANRNAVEELRESALSSLREQEKEQQVAPAAF
ncbi:hypothetical protein [Citrobacter sp. Cf098]|uniref:hypothetical protein n=1 Tax=Citrobacter sp. Cf098 TaxID=2985060 RepID=UPI0025776F3A|nr:hypothetical protein [Citrobacter sp. Cf098]MDM3182005.1 hypothetical protein [Citrobacter sp. Cf098]MDM3182373.1 hypothetical protein [Citrobacter sp. Cf098]